MEARPIDDVEAFLEQASPLLLEDEPRHNLILGLASTIRDAPGLYPERQFWVVQEESEVVAAALRTPPYNLVLARPRNEAALEALVAAVGEDLPGVVAATPEVDDFAQRWTKQYGHSAQLDHAMRIHVLERVQPVPVPPGSVRAATRDDRALLLDWWGAFGAEALAAEEQDDERDVRAVDHRLDDEHAGILLWEDGAIGLVRGLRRTDAQRNSHRPRLHAAGAQRPRLCDRARRRAVGATARGRPPLLLPLHRPRQSDLERDLRADRLRPRLRVGKQLAFVKKV